MAYTVKNISLFLLFIVSVLEVHGQRAEPVIKHFSVEDGLPSSEVYMVIQDSRGYMWFATDRGAVRYNGYQFQVFTTQLGLCDNSVLGVYEDYRKRIWFFTYSKQLSYFENGKMYNCKANTALKHLKRYKVPCSMIVTENDEIIVGFKYAPPDKRYLKIRTDGSIEQFNFHDRDTTCYAIIHQNTTGEFLWNYKENQKLKGLSIQRTGRNPEYYDNPVTKSAEGFSLYQLSDTSMLVSFRNCIYHVNNKSVKLRFCYQSPSTFGLFSDPENNIWIATRDSGILVHDPISGEVLYSFLQDKIVTWICNDREGGIWLTTLNDGVFYIPSFGIKCLRSTRFFNNKRINDIDGRGNTIYLGFYQNQPITRIQYNSSLQLNVDRMESEKNTKGTLVCAPADSDGSLFISGLFTDGTASIVNLLKTGRRATLKVRGTQQMQKYMDSLLILNGHTLYVYDLSTNHLRLLAKFPKHQSFDCFKVDYNLGKIWLGGRDGLCVYASGNLNNLANSHPLLQYRITSIDIRGDDVFLATVGGGVVVISPDSIWNITTEDGLMSDMCNSVLVDHDNLIWVSTNNGLSRIARGESMEIVNYNNANGLLSDEVDETLVLDSFVWIKNDNGLSVFNKFNLKPASTTPRIYIERFSVNNQDTSLLDGHVFKHSQNHIQIDYSALSYKSGGQILYKYRLRGSNEEWQYTDNTSLIYPRLPPGDYFFEVLGKDYKGDWSGTSASIRFSIRIPFWKSYWFIALEILGLFSIFMAVVVIKNRQSRLMMRSVQSEQKALQAQLNPHFAFNAMASIQELLSSGKFKEAKLNLSNMANLFRRILMNSRLSEISIEEEIENLKAYLKMEVLRFDDDLKWSIDFDQEIEQSLTYIPPMLIQPFVENAVWHGLIPKGGGTINIDFQQDLDYICCTVTDNGIGRIKSQEKKGKYNHRPMGMKIVEERLELLNKGQKRPIRIEISDQVDDHENATGTTVFIYIPS